MKEDKKLLLVAINAKYIHSNPAVYSLRAYAKEYQRQIEIAEYTINHLREEVLADIYRRRPAVVAFSCYIWNIEYVRDIIEDLHQLMPEVPIWVGGPEVSYNAEEFLRMNPAVTGVMVGEGERTLTDLTGYYLGEAEELSGISGIVIRESNGDITTTPPAELLHLDEIPFIYESLEHFDNRIIYYESSRGCPYSCSYCLSSIDKSVRFRSLDKVQRELQFFLDRKVAQVKFIDRTFNCNHRHAGAIWEYIRDHDNGITNFHFEIAADLLTDAEIAVLNSLRPGLVQLEIGVQSVNPDTVREIDRVMDIEKLAETVRRIHEGKNIHQHLDLIAGLPNEGMDSFRHSFDEVFRMEPHQLQLGFLKVLKGSKMAVKAADYGLVYRRKAPYEVLFTKWLSYGEVCQLKAVEEMVEVYYNSGQFNHTLRYLLARFSGPYEMFAQMAAYYEEKGLAGRSHSRPGRFQILYDFMKERTTGLEAVFRELLTLDLYLRENSKNRPAWAADREQYKELAAAFYKKEKEEKRVLSGYEGYSYRQLINLTHWEFFCEDIFGHGEAPGLVLFDYRQRDVLTGNARLEVLGS